MADNLETYTVTFYSASDSAQRLGVSINMLRRYAKALEGIQGEGVIKIDPQRGRLYTRAQVETLIAAREYVLAEPGTSVENAMRAALGLADVVVKAPTPPPSERALQAAVEAAMRVALTEAVRPLEEKIGSLEGQIGRLTRQFDKPKPHRVSVIPVDTYREDLERINRELLEELERRHLENEPKESLRPWWRFWRR